MVAQQEKGSKAMTALLPFFINNPKDISQILSKGTKETLSFSFGKAQAFFEAGVDSFVLDCFKKGAVTTPNEINQRFPSLNP